jgi:hypothetical protein
MPFLVFTRINVAHARIFILLTIPPQVKSRKEHKFMDLAGLLQICFVPTLAASLIPLKLNAVSFWNPAIRSYCNKSKTGHLSQS